MNVLLGLGPVTRQVVKAADGDGKDTGIKDLVGGKPDVSFLNDIATPISQLWGWFLGGAVIALLVGLAISFFLLGWARDNEMKAAKAIAGAKNSLYGLAGLLVLLPIAMTLVVAFSN